MFGYELKSSSSSSLKTNLRIRKNPIPTQHTMSRIAQNPIENEIKIVTNVTLFIPPVEFGLILAAVLVVVSAITN